VVIAAATSDNRPSDSANTSARDTPLDLPTDDRTLDDRPIEGEFRSNRQIDARDARGHEADHFEPDQPRRGHGFDDGLQIGSVVCRDSR
jgi:hypothetical protein